MKPKVKWAIRAAVLLIALQAAYGLVATKLTSREKTDDAPSPGPPPVSLSGRVTMIALGATECIPCKMMAPIIENLKKEYAGKADIIFIDVWKHPDQAKNFDIRVIPTQIFYDQNGKEVHRNTGLMDKQRIVDILSRLGAS